MNEHEQEDAIDGITHLLNLLTEHYTVSTVTNYEDNVHSLHCIHILFKITGFAKYV